MNDPMLPLPGLSPVAGKSVVAKFDGGLLSSNGGVLALREVEKRLRVADRFAACIEDPRAPDQITHTLADIIRFRLLMIAAGYEDGNDASDLRRDPLFKMALDLAPSDRELCSQPTISRLENLPDVRSLLRMGRAMIDLYCASFRQVPKRIVCRCLLAAVEPARADAQTLAVARGAVRHLAPSPDQDRRAGGRAEDDDPASPADGVPRPSHPAGCSRAHPASGHMTAGAHTPLTRARPDQPANLTDHTAGPDPASAKACQPPFTHRHAKALEQAGAHHGELIRLRR